MENTPLFTFLNEWQPSWAKEAAEIERVVYHDPPSALTRSRKWMEALLRWVMREEKIVDVYEKLVERINKLHRGGWITESIYQKMEWLRLEGNKAAHLSGYGTVEESLKAHRLVYELAVWWMEVYGDPDFQAPSYRHPPVDKGVDTEELGKIMSKTIEDKFRNFEILLKNTTKETVAGSADERTQTKKGEEKDQLGFDLVGYLKKYGLEPIDNRAAGGSLWVVGGWELNKILFPLKKYQIYFRFSKKGGRATNRRPGWFLLVKASKGVQGPQSIKEVNTERKDVKASNQKLKQRTPSRLFTIPNHLLEVSVHQYTSSPITEYAVHAGIQTFSEITVEGLRDWYLKNRRGFYTLMTQLWFLGTQFEGKLLELIDLQHDLPMEMIVCESPPTRSIDCLPLSVQNNFKRFGIHTLDQMNYLPLDSIQWATQETYQETMAILKNTFSIVLMEKESEPSETVICFEGKQLNIPKELSGLELTPDQFPGCQTVLRRMQQMSIRRVNDLPEDLGILQGLNGVGPGRIRKFFLLLQDALNIQAEKNDVNDKLKNLGKDDIFLESDSFTMPASLLEQELDVSDFSSCPKVIDRLKENGIKRYEQLPRNLSELTSFPGVGKKVLQKFVTHLRSKVDQAEEEQKERQLLQTMSEEERFQYKFDQFAQHIDELLEQETFCDELHIPPRTLDMFRKQYEATLSEKRLTLEELGREYDLTRERIRQLLIKATKKIVRLGKPWIDMVLDLLNRKNGFLSNSFIQERSLRNHLILEALEQQGVSLIFDRQVFTNQNREQISEQERTIKKLVEENLEGSLWTQKEIEDFVAVNADEMGLPKDYVRHYCYSSLLQTADERYILKKYKKKNIAIIVMKEYENGVEIFKEEDTLVEKANRILPGLFKKGREFTAICTRETQDDIYLWGRGVYIHRNFVKEDIDFLQKVATEIAQVLHVRHVVSVYPFFERRKDEMKEQKIPNEYALYSLLRRHCSHIASFPKFPKITEVGSEINIRNEELIKNFIRKKQSPVSMEELRKEFIENRGWKLFTLQFTLNTSSDLLQVDLGEYDLRESYDHIDQKVLQRIRDQIDSKLKDWTSVQINGLYKEFKAYCLSQGIRSNYLLYNLLKIHYGDRYEFVRYPHIGRKGVEPDSVTVISLIENFILAEGNVVHREEVLHWLLEDVGGQAKSLDTALNGSDQLFYYTRGQFGEYVHGDVLGWNENKARQLRNRILQLLENERVIFDTPFLAVEKCLVQEELPHLEIDLPWSFDLLVDCLKKDETFILLGAKGRIIVKADNKEDIKNNTDFVRYVLESDFNGAAKRKDLAKKLIDYQYSADGELLYEVEQQLENGQAPFYEVGDELVCHSLVKEGF